MSIAEEIARIREQKSKIRQALQRLKLVGSTSNPTIDELATTIDNINDKGAPISMNVNVMEGESISIPMGYHDGTGRVRAITDETGEAEKYRVQPKTATPLEVRQVIDNDDGYYALDYVEIEPIPERYKDISNVTATKDDVLANKIFIDKYGVEQAGEMPNNGRIDKTLDTINYWWTIPRGYHDGNGGVSIVGLPVEATPSKEEQYITPEEGTVIDAVTIKPIPDNYVDTSSGDATAAHILKDKKAWVDGSEVTGTMHSHGTLQGTIDGLTHTSFTSLTPGYVSEISIRLTDDIENALKEI